MVSSGTGLTLKDLKKRKTAAWQDFRNSLLPALALSLTEHGPNKWVELSAIFLKSMIPEELPISTFIKCVFNRAWDEEEMGTGLCWAAKLGRRRTRYTSYEWGVEADPVAEARGE